MIAEDVLELDDDDEPEGHVAHVEYGEPDPDCDECQEAAAMRWEDIMRPY